MGGSLGAAQVMRPNQAIQGVESTRLKLNQFLNQSGRQGRVAGNALGILGLFFSTSESGLGYIFDGQTPGWANTLGAGNLQFEAEVSSHTCFVCETSLIS